MTGLAAGIEGTKKRAYVGGTLGQPQAASQVTTPLKPSETDAPVKAGLPAIGSLPG